MKNIIEVSDSTFAAEVLNVESPVLVDFWAPWCAPCRMIAPIVEKLAEKMNGRVKFAKLNTDQSPETAQKFRIMAIPTLIVFKNGQEVDRIIGFQSEDQLEATLLKYVAS